MPRIGIMQGRLIPPTDGRFQCFPRNNWLVEFELAAKAELDCIEWIYDLHGADVNPLATDAGIKEIRSVSSLHGIQISSLCADYFMDKPLLRTSGTELETRWSTFNWLMVRCQLLDMNRIVLPFVDASRIEDEADMDHVCRGLEHALKVAEQTHVEIHLETSLAPDQFTKLLSRLPHPMLKVNYDSGNSSSLGYEVQNEFDAYGTRIGSVHIKDRSLGGGTMPLGRGNADFPTLFKCLRMIAYSGDFILQVARGNPGDEVAWARSNKAFVKKHF